MLEYLNVWRAIIHIPKGKYTRTCADFFGPIIEVSPDWLDCCIIFVKPWNVVLDYMEICVRLKPSSNMYNK